MEPMGVLFQKPREAKGDDQSSSSQTDDDLYYKEFMKIDYVSYFVKNKQTINSDVGERYDNIDERSDDDESVCECQDDSLDTSTENLINEFLEQKSRKPSAEEADTSEAIEIFLNCENMKKYHEGLFLCTLDFVFRLKHKFTLDELFSRGCIPQTEMISVQGIRLQNTKRYHDYAKIALKLFHGFRKDMKIKILKLIRVNLGLSGGLVAFLTFLGVEKKSKRISVYQAALRRPWGSDPDTGFGFGLGLFRDYTNDTILAILSLSGADQEFLEKKKWLEKWTSSTRLYKNEYRYDPCGLKTDTGET
ncbi:Glycine--tRNA ligase alpha subunit [Bienertia sinuspersici]